MRLDRIVRIASSIKIFLRPTRSDKYPQSAVSTAPLRYATVKMTPIITGVYPSRSR